MGIHCVIVRYYNDYFTLNGKRRFNKMVMERDRPLIIVRVPKWVDDDTLRTIGEVIGGHPLFNRGEWVMLLDNVPTIKMELHWDWE